VASVQSSLPRSFLRVSLRRQLALAAGQRARVASLVTAAAAIATRLAKPIGLFGAPKLLRHPQHELIDIAVVVRDRHLVEQKPPFDVFDG